MEARTLETQPARLQATLGQAKTEVFALARDAFALLQLKLKTAGRRLGICSAVIAASLLVLVIALFQIVLGVAEWIAAAESVLKTQGQIFVVVGIILAVVGGVALILAVVGLGGAVRQLRLMEE